jgi:glycerate 2-kinase
MRTLLEQSLRAAINAADPRMVLAQHLPPPKALAQYGKVLVVGAGKAGGSMAAALETAWPKNLSLEGLVVTRYGHGLPTKHIQVFEAGHPVPDQAAMDAARTIFDRACELTKNDLLLVLVSGGGSSLLSLPVDGVAMADLQKVTMQLLVSGAPIEEMNIVRKHLSLILGGRLAQATRASVLALVISDVAGDDLSSIASGPCAPDLSTFDDALLVIKRWGIDAPASVLHHLEQGCIGKIAETPKPGDPLFERVEHRMIATPHLSLEAGAQVLKQAGYETVILGDTIAGEARDVAQVIAALTREIIKFNQPFKAPVALISGGECTVTIKPSNHATGRGGRCTEFLLALALALGQQSRVNALAADTDGIDGSESNAGAVFLVDTLARAKAAGISARKLLDANDAYGFFENVGGLVYTGPTLTNVNDYRVVLIN